MLVFAYPLVMASAAHLYFPVFTQANITTSYSYLEYRYDFNINIINNNDEFYAYENRLLVFALRFLFLAQNFIKSVAKDLPRLYLSVRLSCNIFANLHRHMFYKHPSCFNYEWKL